MNTFYEAGLNQSVSVRGPDFSHVHIDPSDIEEFLNEGGPVRSGDILKLEGVGFDQDAKERRSSIVSHISRMNEDRSDTNANFPLTSHLRDRCLSQSEGTKSNKRTLEQAGHNCTQSTPKKYKALRRNSIEDFVASMVERRRSSMEMRRNSLLACAAIIEPAFMFDRRNSLATIDATGPSMIRRRRSSMAMRRNSLLSGPIEPISLTHDPFDSSEIDVEYPLGLLCPTLSATQRRRSLCTLSNAALASKQQGFSTAGSLGGITFPTNRNEMVAKSMQTCANDMATMQALMDPTFASQNMIKLARDSLLQSMERSTKSLAALQRKVPSQMQQVVIKTLRSRRSITNHWLSSDGK